jgi:hypothetical protein
MEDAVVFSAAPHHWQSRFRNPVLSRQKILHHFLKITTFVLNTSQKLKALRKIQLSKQNSLHFLERHVTSLNFGAFYSRCKPPGTKGSFSSGIKIILVRFRTCQVQGRRLTSSASPAFFSTIRQFLEPSQNRHVTSTTRENWLNPRSQGFGCLILSTSYEPG